MEKMSKIIKTFIESILIIFTKDDTQNKEYDTENYTMYYVTITNPHNNKSIRCKTLIDNILIPKNGKIGLFVKHNFLMEILLDYLYKIEKDPTLRDKFSEVFTEEDIKLLIKYYDPFPSFRRLREKYEYRKS